MNYIITKHPEFFKKIGQYNYCSLEQLDTLPKVISFDSETTGLFALEEDMFCCQIGTGTDNYIVHMYDDNYTFEEVIPYIEDKELVTQNGCFDLGFMYKHNFIPKVIWDTFLASKILYNGDYTRRKNDFGTLMEKELGVYYDKTDQKNIHIVKLSKPSAIKYSFNDVDRLMELHDVLVNKLKERGQYQTYLSHCRFIKALAYIEQCGLPISPERWYKKMQDDIVNRDAAEKEIHEYLYDAVPSVASTQLDFFQEFEKTTHLNLQSQPQMVPIFEKLGINIKDKDGKSSIKADIISKSDHPFVNMWLKYQEHNHRVTTFGKNVYDKIKNGRIYTNFNPMVDTARLSTRKDHINFLNFSKDKATRSCFQASLGNKMIVCDWSGQETVIMADVSGDEAMTASVLNGEDLHCMLARKIYPELEPLSDEVIKEQHDDKRTDAKAPRFAMQYGGNAYTLHINENIPLDRAEMLFEAFTELHEGLFAWGEKELLKAIKTGYIESADGWRLQLPQYDWFMDLDREINAMTKSDWALYRVGKTERKREYDIEDFNKKRDKSKTPAKVFKPLHTVAYEYYKRKRKKVSDYFKIRSNYKRLALNNPIQTRGAHQMKLALSLIFEWIVDNNYLFIVKICNAVHDEVVIECPEELAEEVKEMVEKYMRKAGDHYLETLKIKADANIGDDWYEAK